MARGTLVILHGWTRGHKRWQPLITQLQKQGYRVLYLTLPGFAEGDLDRVWSLADYGSWVRQRLTQAKVKAFWLMAHSNGGRIAIQLGADHPPGLRGLVLIASAGVLPSFSVKTGLFWLVAKIGKIILAFPGLSGMRRAARSALYTLARERDYFEAPPHLARTMQRLIRLDLIGAAKRVRVPALLVWGGRDRTTPLRDGLRFAAVIPQARLVVFPEATHALPYRQPKLLAQEITRFLTSW